MYFRQISPCTSRATNAAVQLRTLRLSAVHRWQNYDNERHYEPGEDVPKRVWHGLTYDFRRWRTRYYQARKDAFRRKNPIAFAKKAPMDHEMLPFRTDFLVIGGGLTGSAVAFWLKQGFRDEDLKVTVVENNDKFPISRSMLSAGVITQQFSIPEFVEMALYSAEFMRHAGEHLKILDNDPPEINLLPVGFLNLASTEEHSDKMREAWKVQVSKGARVAFLNATELSERFPFMDFTGIRSGTLGLENEGIIDTWQLLSALREKNLTLGVHYVKADVEGFFYRQFDQVPRTFHGYENSVEEADEKLQRMLKIDGVILRPQMTGASARQCRSYQVINAAGPWSGEIAEKAGIGKGSGLFAVPIPIKRRKRMSFLINVPDAPIDDMPALVDPSGVHCRPDAVGHNYVCGRFPDKEEDAKMDHSNLEVDYNYFYERVWPVLVKRVPAFKSAKVINGWAEYADVNTFDDAPVLGEHFMHNNFYTMSGFANYGPQMAIAAGKLYSEKIYDMAYTTTNVRKFDMRRIMQLQPTHELYQYP